MFDNVAADYYDQASDDDDDDNNAGVSHLADSFGGITLDYASQLVDAPKKINAQNLTYSRVAKRVDVKRLKNNMWTSLNGQTVSTCKPTDSGDKGLV